VVARTLGTLAPHRYVVFLHVGNGTCVRHYDIVDTQNMAIVEHDATEQPQKVYL
jgi:hypothetical protein